MIASIISQKQALRQELSEFRKSTITDITLDSLDALENQAWFHKAKIISLYVSQSFEFPTKELFDLCIRKHKKICAPVMDAQRNLTFRKITTWPETKLSDKIVFKPLFGEEIFAQNVDVFFVPLVAFDRSGNRLGRNGGSYDRLFADHRVGGVKVGLGFEFQEQFSVPVETHDIAMEYILTEKRIIRAL